MLSSNNYVAEATLQRQKTNATILESALRQHKLENENLALGTKITKEITPETKKIIEQQLKNKGAKFDDVKDSFYKLDKKKIKLYIKGQMEDFDRYFSSDSKYLEGMVFTYDTITAKKEGAYSGSYVLLEVEGDGGEVTPIDPPKPIVCSTDPSTDSTIRLPLKGDGKTIITPYEITTIGEFQAIKLSPNSYYKLMNDLEACVTKNWHNGQGFEPLETFTGLLRTNNFYINNLTINRPLEDNVGVIRNFVSAPGNLFDLKLRNSVIVGRDNVGTLAGTFSKAVISQSKIENGVVKGRTNVGGVVGNNNVNTATNISRTSFQGEVTGETNVGGMAGKSLFLDITDSFMRGKIVGNDFVGGLVGNRSDRFATLKNTYIDTEIQGKTNTRILTGTSTGTDFITNVFYNKDKATGIIIDTGIGKTTTELKTQVTFIGYDFTTKWIIDLLKNDGFPYLK